MVTTKFLKRKKRKEGAMQELQRTTRESKHATERTAILAAVVPEKAHPFVLEELDLDEPREDEVLVRVVKIQFFKYEGIDRKSTRLNSSHVRISYAVFCLKKKKITGSNSIFSLTHSA